MGNFIDLARWERREHFHLFRNVSHPFFSVCVEVEVGPLRAVCGGPDRPSFFLGALYYALRAANEIDAFRRRIRGDEVWLHDRVGVTSTILRTDDTFGFGRFELTPNLAEFVARGREEVLRAQRVGPLSLPEGDDALVYHSTLPWLRFTSFTNAIDMGADSIPRIVFGKCVQEGSAWRMPVAVEVHHALADGLDVALFIEALDDGLSQARP